MQGVDLSGGGPVGSTGTIRLTNGVRIRDRIYQLTKTAVFGPGTTWTFLIGIGHLDVCTWSLEPRDPCIDFNPKSQNCPWRSRWDFGARARFGRNLGFSMKTSTSAGGDDWSRSSPGEG